MTPNHKMKAKAKMKAKKARDRANLETMLLYGCMGMLLTLETLGEKLDDADISDATLAWRKHGLDRGMVEDDLVSMLNVCASDSPLYKRIFGREKHELMEEMDQEIAAQFTRVGQTWQHIDSGWYICFAEEEYCIFNSKDQEIGGSSDLHLAMAGLLDDCKKEKYQDISGWFKG